MILLQLFVSFLQIGLLSIGGGYAAMPLIRSQVVETHHWLSMSEFTDLVTIAEMTPGPIAVNSATFVGIRIAGLPGAIVSTIGCILPSFVIVTVMGYLYYRYSKLTWLQSILGSLRPAVVALIAGAGLTIIDLVLWSDRHRGFSTIDPLGIVMLIGAFLLLRKKKLNPIPVMLLCGAASLVFSIITGNGGKGP